MTDAVRQFLERMGDLPLSEIVPAREDILKRTQNFLWVPNPGPQTLGYECLADELYYGGEAGGGKTDLICGLAINEHKVSLILRRIADDASSMAERLLEIIGSRDGYNGTKMQWKNGNQFIRFSGCKDENDKQRNKGRAKDFYAFDEIGDFTYTMYKFITAWNRSADPEQRCRIVCTGNPPTDPEGLWVIDYWGAWLQPTHPNPAEEGELRWYTTHPDTGKNVEVDGRGPHKFKDADGNYIISSRTGKPDESLARSRTFIRARLEDNPDLSAGDYQATLDGLSKLERDAFRDGNFKASIKDKVRQVIPTAWVIAAQDRWKERPPYQVPMCAIAGDPSGGGADENVIAMRYDGWFAPLIVIPGKETPVGTDFAGDIIKVRKDEALVIIDTGGGYGGSSFKTLKENGIDVKGFKGSERSVARTNEGQVRFYNKRAESIWRFREALDPDQEWGSPIMLPPDSELRADLTAPTFTLPANGILIESKDDIKKRIGRSTGKGDAVTMAWSEGQKQVAYLYQSGSTSEQGLGRKSRQTTADMGKRRRRSRRR